MKRITYLILAITILAFASSCDKFLNVTPIDNLSGNNYWKNEGDAEKFANGLYIRLRSRVLNNSITFYTFGDIRCAPIQQTSTTQGISQLINNDMKGAVASSNTSFSAATNWKPFYDVIQSANIMVKEVTDMPATSISDEARKKYIAEAVFLRNLCYFLMVRMYSDVPYYIDAYSEEPLGRTNQLEVMRKCIADMDAVKDDLPIIYADATQIGARAMRGGALALLMHMNMWVAGFESGDKSAYYQKVVKYGQELADYSQYKLLPLNVDNNKKIFKGGTSESLFELPSNTNYGEVLSLSDNPSFFFSRYPFYGTANTVTTRMNFQTKFMDLIFPAGNGDLRRVLWFDNPNVGNNTFQLKKFSNTFPTGTNNTISHDDNRMIFRLADAYLLTAEAAANLEDEETARTFVNKVRERAQVPLFTSSGSLLKDDIYYERVRELFCEGHYFYDLVRTKKILDADYTTRPISVSDFNDGAWTWPINASALTNNPNMSLNNFWR